MFPSKSPLVQDDPLFPRKSHLVEDDPAIGRGDRLFGALVALDDGLFRDRGGALRLGPAGDCPAIGKGTSSMDSRFRFLRGQALRGNDLRSENETISSSRGFPLPRE